MLSEVALRMGALPLPVQTVEPGAPGVPVIASVGFVKDEVHMDVTTIKEEPREVLMDNGLPLPRPEENDDHVHDDVFGDANEDVLMGDEVPAPGDDLNLSNEHLNDDREDNGMTGLEDFDDGEEGEENVSPQT